MAPSPKESKDQDSWWFLIVMALIQVSAWGLLLIWSFMVVPFCVSWFQVTGTTYPPILDTYVFRPASFILDYALWAVLTTILFAIVNFGWLAFLGRSRTGRIVREVWAGLLIILPSLLLFGSSAVLFLVVSLAAESNNVSVFDSAADDELHEWNLLRGQWQLASIEQSGQVRKLAPNETGSLRVTVKPAARGRKFSCYIYWQYETDNARGLMRIDMRSPKRIEILRMDKHNVNRFQHALYSFDGDRLRIIFSPPGTPDAELPSSFATRETDNVQLVFQR